MENKIETALTIVLVLFFILVGIFICYEINDFMTDYDCSTMPLNQFFQEKKCEKYWKYRNGDE